MGVLMVYDVTNLKSFESINAWVQRVDQHCTPDVIRIIVGNKSDLAPKRKVSTEEGKALAAKYGVKHFETSAKIDEGVTDAFMTMARDVKEKRVEAELEAEMKKRRASTLPAQSQSGPLNLADQTPAKGACCAGSKQ